MNPDSLNRETRALWDLLQGEAAQHPETGEPRETFLARLIREAGDAIGHDAPQADAVDWLAEALAEALAFVWPSPELAPEMRPGLGFVSWALEDTLSRLHFRDLAACIVAESRKDSPDDWPGDLAQ